MVAGALILFGVLAVATLVVGAVVLASQSRRQFRDANQVVRGVKSQAPESWAGSHDPEARLHRRLRDAKAALTANQAFDDDGGLLDLRVDLEQQAQSLDSQLVGIAGLAPELRQAQLKRAEQSVAAVEATVASLVGVSASDSEARLDRLLTELRSRTGSVAEARNELDGEPGPGAGSTGSTGSTPF